MLKQFIAMTNMMGVGRGGRF